MKPHYSGALSRKFWAEVRTLKEPDHSVMYALGVVLQDLEERVLRNLAVAFRRKPKKP